MNRHDNTTEAQAVRAHRLALRRSQNPDKLAERARLVAFWRECAKTHPAYRPHNGAWWSPLVRQPGLRRWLLDSVRTLIEAQERTEQQRFTAELQEYSRKYERQKAERRAARDRAKLPQLDLIDHAEQGAV